MSVESPAFEEFIRVNGYEWCRDRLYYIAFGGRQPEGDPDTPILNSVDAYDLERLRALAEPYTVEDDFMARFSSVILSDRKSSHIVACSIRAAYDDYIVRKRRSVYISDPLRGLVKPKDGFKVSRATLTRRNGAAELTIDQSGAWINYRGRGNMPLKRSELDYFIKEWGIENV